MCLLAGDISPIDVITPLPVLCEDNDVPYIYVPSKDELGQAGLTKRPTSCMLLLPKPVKGALPDDEEGREYKEAYEEVGGWVETGQGVQGGVGGGGCMRQRGWGWRDNEECAGLSGRTIVRQCVGAVCFGEGAGRWDGGCVRACVLAVAVLAAGGCQEGAPPSQAPLSCALQVFKKLQAVQYAG